MTTFARAHRRNRRFTINNVSALVIAGLFGALLLDAAALGGVSSTMVSTEAGPASPDSGSPAPPLDLDRPWIRGASQSSGWSVLGVNFGGSTTLSIEFPVSQSCFQTIASGDDWPVAHTACEPDPSIAGVITSTDSTQSLGPRLVVEINVSKDCYGVAGGGSPWPTGLPECAEEERNPR